MRILCIDDDPEVLAYYDATLSALGHVVVTTAQPTVGLERAAQEPFPVALVDLLMPEMDGREVCRRLRASDGRGHYTTLIVVTVLSEKHDYLETMAAGADDFLSKPLDAQVLAARLQVAERVRRLRIELAQTRAFLPMCMHCRHVRDEAGRWMGLEHYLASHEGPAVTHGLCPSCALAHYA